MLIWEWVLGWFGTGDTLIFNRVGKVARTHSIRAVAKTNYSRAVVKTNYNRDYS